MNSVYSTLIKCPNCAGRKDNDYMGSITDEGYFISQRKFGRHTMVIAEEYSLICDCGYFIRIENGKITASAPTANMHG